jgi:hypothetical protein
MAAASPRLALAPSLQAENNRQAAREYAQADKMESEGFGKSMWPS